MTRAACGGALLATCSCGAHSSDDATSTQAPPARLDTCEAQAGFGGAALVDDFEDGDLQLNDDARFKGFWYVNNDGTGTQLPKALFEGVPVALLQGPGSPASPQLALHTSGSGFTLWGAFVAARLNAARGEACTFDLSNYDRISFSAKGVGSLRVNVGTLATTPVDDGGACHLDRCSDYGQDVALTDEWQDLSVEFAELSQPRWASTSAWTPERALRLAFWSTAGDFDFWIDDLRFERSP